MAHAGPALPAGLRAGLCALLRRTAAEVIGADAAGPVVMDKGSDGIDLVTGVDLAMQERLAAGLAALLPGSQVRGEEGYAADAAPAGGPVWLVDPLDGTVNFVAGLPAYGVAAVLVEDGEAVLAAVLDIPHDTCWSAVRGAGAWRDEAAFRHRPGRARLMVLSSGLIADLAARAPAVLGELLARRRLRNFGAQALHLCLAAEGRIDLVASREARGWDDMAGALIAREAGLRYGSYAPGPPPPADAEQFSLCAPAEHFDSLRAALAATLARGS